MTSPRTWVACILAPTTYMTMNDREHWRPHAAKVKLWRKAAHRVARAEWLAQLPPCHVGIVLEVPDRRRRDPHNYYPTIKALVDGLVDAGLWPDDTPDYVTTHEPMFRVTKRGQPQYVHITLTERTA